MEGYHDFLESKIGAPDQGSIPPDMSGPGAARAPLREEPVAPGAVRKPAKKAAPPFPAEPELAPLRGSLDERLAFLERHNTRLGPQQRENLERLQKARDAGQIDDTEASRRIASWEQTVDRSLKSDYLNEINRVTPFPVFEVGRVPGTTAGEAEQLSHIAQGGDLRRLSMTSRLKSGERIQLDGYAPDRRIPREVKDIQDADFAHLPRLEREARIHKLQTQMEKGAQFALDYGLSYVEWEVPSWTMRSLEANVYAKVPSWVRRKIRLVEGVL
jgi:hypothetical protein